MPGSWAQKQKKPQFLSWRNSPSPGEQDADEEKSLEWRELSDKGDPNNLCCIGGARFTQSPKFHVEKNLISHQVLVGCSSGPALTCPFCAWTVILNHSSLAGVARAKRVWEAERQRHSLLKQTLRMAYTLLYPEFLKNHLKTCGGTPKGRQSCTMVKRETVESGGLGWSLSLNH